jgi:hypothetical protein
MTMAKAAYDQAHRDGSILRDAIKAIEKAEQVPELQLGERAKLYAAKSALEYALLRIAINLLEQQAGVVEKSD